MNINLINANSKHIPLKDQSVHMGVFSPPYWSKRVYSGTTHWIGGNPDCNHEAARKKTRFDYEINKKQSSNTGSDLRIYDSQCPDCGAVREDSQLGMESLHDCLAWARGEEPCGKCFVCNMRSVFFEVWRVLRDDGTVWLNLGDSYYGGKGKSSQAWSTENQDRDTLQKDHHQISGRGETRPSDSKINGLKPKDLVGIPWRVALALQADGWYLRSDIIWNKTAPMPGSMKDRPTTAHEYIFLLSKSKGYFFDNEAVKEPLSAATLADIRNSTGRHTQGINSSKYYDEDSPDAENADKPSWYRSKSFVNSDSGRNIRSVWTLNPDPFFGEHFATYSREIPRRAIKAGTSEVGCCPICGQQWERIVETEQVSDRPNRYPVGDARGKCPSALRSMGNAQQSHIMSISKTVGFHPACDCDAEPVPCTVLDLFNGSGTTGIVCNELGRNYIGIDLSMKYLQLSKERIGLTALENWENGVKIAKKQEKTQDLSELPLFSMKND